MKLLLFYTSSSILILWTLSINQKSISEFIKDIFKELLNSTQRDWILKIYKHLNIQISKITHAKQNSETKNIEKLDIDVEQIQRADRWIDNFMHKDYFISLPRQFIRDIIDFQLKHVDTYFIVKKYIQSSKELLKLIFSKFNHWMKQSTKDITIKQFLKLLIYLRRIFL